MESNSYMSRNAFASHLQRDLSRKHARCQQATPRYPQRCRHAEHFEPCTSLDTLQQKGRTRTNPLLANLLGAAANSIGQVTFTYIHADVVHEED